MAACTGSGQAQVNYSAEATVATPTLVEVQPGVQVVADYDQPVFFSEGVYWRYEGGIWYRSPYHNRGWVHVATVPLAVRQLNHPEAYVHYHASANANARAEERHEQNEERREDKQEIKQERKDDREVAHDKAEVREENKEIARDNKQERKDEKERAKDEKELKKDEKKRDKDRR